eukprot:SAG31_NODE_473_length_15222_cov_4.788005_6_plen_1062_part_00
MTWLLNVLVFTVGGALVQHSFGRIKVDGKELLKSGPHQIPAHILAERDDVTAELMFLTCDIDCHPTRSRGENMSTAPSCQPNLLGDTPLHALFAPSNDFLSICGCEENSQTVTVQVKKLLAGMDSSVPHGKKSPLVMKNRAGETPVHVLARRVFTSDTEQLRTIYAVLAEIMSLCSESMLIQDTDTGQTALHVLCSNDMPQIADSSAKSSAFAEGIEALLNSGAVIPNQVTKARDSLGQNPLHHLLANPVCDDSVLRIYLSKFDSDVLKAAMSQEDARGMRPLHAFLSSLSSTRRTSRSIGTLVQTVADMIHELKGYIPKDIPWIYVKDKKKMSPLHYAIDFIDAKALQALISINVDEVCCVQDKLGSTILHRACESFDLRPELIQMIMKHTPSCAKIRDKEGRTALHILARRNCKTPSCDRLICIEAIASACTQAVNIQVQERTGLSQARWADNTVLHDVCAAPYVDEQFISVLLEAAPDAGESINLAGCTALQTLLQRDDVEDVTSLVKCFSRLSPKSVPIGGINKKGRAPDSIPTSYNTAPTALHLVCERTDISTELVNALGPGAQHAAVVADSAGRTPLHILCLRPDLLDIPNCVAIVRRVMETNPVAATIRALFDKGLNRGAVHHATPAHLICCRPRLTPDLLRVIFKLCPLAARTRDMDRDRLVMDPVIKRRVSETVAGELPINRLLTNSKCVVTADMLEAIAEATGEAMEQPSLLLGKRNSMHLLAQRTDVTVDGLRAVAKFCPRALNQQDTLGQTPLHRLCGNPSVNLRTLQVLGNMDPRLAEIADEHGRTPLHSLLECPEAISNETMVPMLVALSQLSPSSIVAKGPLDRTPLHVLTRGSRLTEQALHSMTSAGGETCARLQDLDECTPIHYCATNRMVTLPMLRCLVGQDPTTLAVQDKDGATALHRLIQNRALLKRPEAEFVQMLQYVVQSYPAVVSVKNYVIKHGHRCDHQTALNAIIERRIVSPTMLRVIMQARPNLACVVDGLDCSPLNAITRRKDITIDVKISLRKELQSYIHGAVPADDGRQGRRQGRRRANVRKLATTANVDYE